MTKQTDPNTFFLSDRILFCFFYFFHMALEIMKKTRFGRIGRSLTMACESEPLFFPAQKLFYRIFPRKVNVFPERSVRATLQVCDQSSHLTTQLASVSLQQTDHKILFAWK